MISQEKPGRTELFKYYTPVNQIPTESNLKLNHLTILIKQR